MDAVGHDLRMVFAAIVLGIVLLTPFVVFGLGVAKKVVIYYDTRDLFTSISPPLLLSFARWFVFEPTLPLDSAYTQIIVRGLVSGFFVFLSIVFLIRNFRLAIHHNKSIFIGIIVGVCKLFLGYLVVWMLGAISAQRRAEKEQHKRVDDRPLLTLPIVGILFAALVNGEAVYYLKGWQPPLIDDRVFLNPFAPKAPLLHKIAFVVVSVLSCLWVGNLYNEYKKSISQNSVEQSIQETETETENEASPENDTEKSSDETGDNTTKSHKTTTEEFKKGQPKTDTTTPDTTPNSDPQDKPIQDNSRFQDDGTTYFQNLYVISKNAIVRSRPNPHSPSLGILPFGKKVLVSRKAEYFDKSENTKSEWYRVLIGDQYGWVNPQLLGENIPEDSQQEVE